MTRKIIFILLLVIIIIGLLLGFSYRNPGKIRLIDRMRVPAQSAIMAHFSDYQMDAFNILEDPDEDTSHRLNITDIKPYLDILQAGDILFTNSEKYLSSQFIPGEWKHSLIYLGNMKDLETLFDKRSMVFRAVKQSKNPEKTYLIFDSSVDGVGVRHISRLSNLKDNSMLIGLAAFRVKRDKDQVIHYMTHAFGHLGKKYDYDLLTDDTEAIYCSELLYDALQQIGIHLPVNERVYGRNIITPDGAAQYMMREGVQKNEFELLFVIKKKDGLIVEKQIAEAEKPGLVQSD